MTHDSIGLGEDGPTHQPVETMELLRATPNMNAFRPADGNEVRARRQAVERQYSQVMFLSRCGRQMRNMRCFHGRPSARVKAVSGLCGV